MRLHDPRHGWATRLAAAGVPLTDIQRLGGWHSLTMVQRYASSIPSGADERAFAALEGRSLAGPQKAAEAPARAQERAQARATGTDGPVITVVRTDASDDGAEACAAAGVARPEGVEPSTLRSVV